MVIRYVVFIPQSITKRGSNRLTSSCGYFKSFKKLKAEEDGRESYNDLMLKHQLFPHK